MHRFMYISTATSYNDDNEMASILRVSRRNNARDDITGLLVKGGPRFLQVLEGPERAVRATYQRILADPRHKAAVELIDEPCAERQFGDWAMGYEVGGLAGIDNNIRAVVANLVDTIADRYLKAHFTSFAELHAR
ncbi:MAG: BLUF domain-containing protein [Sphingomonadales bacterium]|nr:BLUF domain-containing protein [Sphingomonadales bacterium]